LELVHPLAEQYAALHTTAEDALLQEVAAYTNGHHREPHMLSGQVQGKLLEMISCMIRPRRILEIGTLTGYSALCLAKGLAADGQLHTIELREADAAVATAFFKRSAFAGKIIQHTGDAATLIGKLEEEWDLVFLDADKTGYISYFNLVFPKLRQNGFILADNVLFHGQVLEDPVKGKSARAVAAFNDFINKQAGIEKVMLTVRDGLYLLRKL
jgi:caffeoyl-CoA O-methyltransferase